MYETSNIYEIFQHMFTFFQHVSTDTKNNSIQMLFMNEYFMDLFFHVV